jgi:hypothetical protein
MNRVLPDSPITGILIAGPLSLVIWVAIISMVIQLFK